MIDRENPWPGLASYSEETQALFYGRDAEVAELSRRVQRKLLTVLFGQSGLGKTSMLRAGVVPRLRRDGYCPVYVRIDYGESAPAPGEQVRQAVERALAASGGEGAELEGGARPDPTRGPGFKPDAPLPAISVPTLWEFLHLRGEIRRDGQGRELIPLIIFDQFEEIFTLAQGNEAGRARAAAFIEGLADIVENRPPRAVEARLENDDTVLDRFDFSRDDYRVLISLREDFLPHLEALKSRMPSITQNRMRLARMTGLQALEAVVKPGGELVTEDVAVAIVEFVSGARGGSRERLAELDVEPPLLSVICRELNERRRALGQARISADLVSGNRREILTDFYERSVADLPEAMRRFVEDRLLTKSGFRDNLALETALEEPGVSRDLIDILVSRRLLRIEDRLGVQRVELTHDVLAEVIRGSRDARQQRLALESERRRESQTRRRMWLARGIATGLLVCLAGVSWLAWWAVKREQANARRWSRSDVSVATRLLEEGRAQDGLAFLAHAAEVDSGNIAVAPRLISALAVRSFPRPFGAAINLPAGAEQVFFQGDDILVHRKDDVVTALSFATGEVKGELRLGADFRQLGVAGRTLWVIAGRDITLYEVGSLRQRVRIVPGPDEGLRAIPDGVDWFGTIDSEALLFRDGKTGAVMARAPHSERAASLSYSNNPARLVISEGNGEGRVWSVPDGRQIGRTFPAGEAVRMSRDGTRIAVVRGESVELRDGASAESLGIVVNHGAKIWSAFFSPDGTLLATAGYDYTAKVWDVRTGVLVGSSLAHGGAISHLRFVANGKWLLTTGADTVRVWDIATGRPVVEPMQRRKDVVTALEVDGRRLVSVAPDGSVQRAWLEPQTFSPMVLSGSDRRLGSAWVRDRPATLRWVTETGLVAIDAVTGRDAPGTFQFPEPIAAYLMAPFAQAMIVRTKAGVKKAWQIRAGGVESVDLEAPPESAATLPIMRGGNGEFAASFSGGDRRHLRVWNLRTGRLLPAAMPYDSALYSQSINFSADGQWVGAGTTGGQARVWEVATGRLVHDLKPLRGRVFDVVFSPDRSRIATADRAGARLWDARTGQPVGEILEHSTPFVEIGGFSRDSRQLATYSSGSVRIWDTRTGRPVSGSMDHSGVVAPPAFSPDGTKIATACSDGAVRLWDVQSGQLVAEPMRHGLAATSVMYSPDGRFIRVNGSDRRVRIWAVPPLEGGGTPSWLTELATAYSGRKVNADGVLVDAGRDIRSIEQLRAVVQALPANAPWAEWGKWLYMDPATRPLAPGFQITLAEAEARGMIVAPTAAEPAPAPGLSPDQN